MTTASPIACILFDAPPPNASRTVSHCAYLSEIFAHAGMPVDFLNAKAMELMSQYRILVTIGDEKLDEAWKQALTEWIEAGGVWLSIGGTCGLEEVLGVIPEPPSYSSWGGGRSNLGEGYLYVEEMEHPALAHIEIPLHFFNGLPAKAQDAAVLATAQSAHQRPTERVAFSENLYGMGRAFFLAVDLTGTIVHIQQGRAITRDGVPASDGTAPVCDNVLKSDDGMVLDWEFDRQPVEGVPGYSVFLQPIADQWRELLLRTIFYAAVETNTPLPLLWLYPRNLPALAHLSHDTDGNTPAEADKLLETLQSLDIRSTWCVILPGYEPERIAAIKAAGHELATHYDSMSAGTNWCEEEFDEQWKQLVEQFGEGLPVSNKNHYLRWQGDTEFFEWCVKRGIQLDQSKGASKSGEAGFLFGTCHPYFPVTPSDEALDVLEMTTPTQDLTVFAPTALLPPLVAAAEKHHGILHLLFHPAHIFKPGVIEAMQEAAEHARAAGMEFWTAAQLNHWERARRQVAWSGYQAEDGNAQIHVSTSVTLLGATLMLLAMQDERPTTHDEKPCTVNGAAHKVETVVRWGFTFHSIVFDVEAGQNYHIVAGD